MTMEKNMNKISYKIDNNIYTFPSSRMQDSSLYMHAFKQLTNFVCAAAGVSEINTHTIRECKAAWKNLNDLIWLVMDGDLEIAESFNLKTPQNPFGLTMAKSVAIWTMHIQERFLNDVLLHLTNDMSLLLFDFEKEEIH